MNIADILNILSFYVPIAWLAVILIYWNKKQEFNYRLIKYGILAMIALFVVQGVYFTFATYNVWKTDSISRYLLPPHNSAYFFGYAYYHFWRAGVVSLLMGLAWSGFLFFVRRYLGERVLDKTDIALGFFTAMVVGWPKIFAYLALAFGLLVLRGIINAVVLKDKSGIAIASSIALSALVIAGFSNFIMQLSFFNNWRL